MSIPECQVFISIKTQDLKQMEKCQKLFKRLKNELFQPFLGGFMHTMGESGKNGKYQEELRYTAKRDLKSERNHRNPKFYLNLDSVDAEHVPHSLRLNMHIYN